MAQKNKVQFNLKNVHYAILTETITDNQTTYTWATPVHVPGAVSISLDAQSELSPFYADGIVYYQTVANNGYEGDLELAKITDQMYQEIFGMTLGSTSKVIVDNAFTEPKPFALLFQIDGDAGNELYCLYNCKATRPAIGSQTNTDSKEPQTQTCTISARPLEDGDVFARTTGETPAETKEGWFNAVYREAA